MYTNVSAARIFISINRKTITNTQILKNKCLVTITISWKFLFSMKSTLLSEELLRFGSFLFIHLLIYIYNLFAIDTVRVFLPKCPLTTVKSRFSADKLQIVWSEGCIRCITTLKGSDGCIKKFYCSVGNTRWYWKEWNKSKNYVVI
mgnify:CR=1 FL=1